MEHINKSHSVKEWYLKARSVINLISAHKDGDYLRIKKIMMGELPLALYAFRADLGIYPLPNDDGFCNLAALNDRLMVPSYLQHKWNGPYINMKIRSWDLNKNNILPDEENDDIRYGVMVVPSRHFRNMTEIKNGVSVNPDADRYCSVVALLPNNIAECLKMELGNSLAIYEWDSRLSLVFYAIAPMLSPLHR
jgi:hypothetical protein